MSDVIRILADIERGDRQAAAELLPLVYDELRRLAASRLAREAPGQTLQPTALVHEAYLRLVGSDPDNAFDGRGHFFAVAAEAMRRILIDPEKVVATGDRGSERSIGKIDRRQSGYPARRGSNRTVRYRIVSDGVGLES